MPILSTYANTEFVCLGLYVTFITKPCEKDSKSIS